MFFADATRAWSGFAKKQHNNPETLKKPCWMSDTWGNVLHDARALPHSFFTLLFHPQATSPSTRHKRAGFAHGGFSLKPRVALRNVFFFSLPVNAARPRIPFLLRQYEQWYQYQLK